MKSGFSVKPVITWFAIVLVLYGAAFYGIEHLRQRKGPWQVSFQTNAAGDPMIEIAQSHLKIAGVRLLFHGEPITNTPGLVRFDRVLRPVPFGRVIYEDLTFQPGVVTFDLFGHEIELLPRLLIVNKRSFPWSNGLTVDLWPTNKPATPPQPPKAR